MKRRLRNIISDADLDKYEMIEINGGIRNLEEINRKNNYYGFKMQA